MANNKNVLPNTKRVKIDKLPKEPNIEKQYKDALKLYGDNIKPLEKEQLKKIKLAFTAALNETIEELKK